MYNLKINNFGLLIKDIKLPIFFTVCLVLLILPLLVKIVFFVQKYECSMRLKTPEYNYTLSKVSNGMEEKSKIRTYNKDIIISSGRSLFSGGSYILDLSLIGTDANKICKNLSLSITRMVREYNLILYTNLTPRIVEEETKKFSNLLDEIQKRSDFRGISRWDIDRINKYYFYKKSHENFELLSYTILSSPKIRKYNSPYSNIKIFYMLIIAVILSILITLSLGILKLILKK